jgi:CubicO group peptidase (beta-lactamase class C family)
MRNFIIVIIVLMIVQCSPAQVNKHDAEIAKIDSLKVLKIDGIFSNFNNETPGCAVAIIQNEEIVFIKCYGMADPKRKIPISSDTKFPIGSNTKQFTCMAILLLEEQGKLKIDDPIKKYLPQLPEYANSVTIKNLMQHTSGIIEYNPLLFLSGLDKNECNITNQDIIDLISKYKKLSYKTCEKFLYTNSTYVILAEIIEKVSQRTYAEFIKENILIPLKMGNSFVVTSSGDYKTSAIGFNYNGNYKPVNCPMVTTGGSGIITTLNDLCKWINNYYTHQLGKYGQELINKMQQKGVLKNGDSTKYGLGLFIDEYCGQKVLWHGGNITGYTSNITIFPEQKTSIIVLSNTMELIPYEHRFDIAKVLFGACEMKSSDLFAEDELRKDFKKKKSEFTGQTIDFSEYIGKYSVEGFSKYFEIVDNNGKLIAKIDNKEFQLKQVFKDTFISEPMIFEFRRNKNGEILSIWLSGEKFRNLELTKNN